MIEPKVMEAAKSIASVRRMRDTLKYFHELDVLIAKSKMKAYDACLERIRKKRSGE